MHEHKRFDAEAATWDDDPGPEERQVAVAQAIEEALDLNPRMSAVVTDPSAGMVQVSVTGCALSRPT